MSYFGFYAAGSALDAFQAAEDVVANNIANVQTPGASRQIANLAPAPPVVGSPFYSANPASGQGTRGQGVLVSSITRVHQDSYDALFRGATSAQNFYSIQQQVLQGAQSALGEPAAGINTAYTAFQTAVQTLDGNPSGIPERTGVLTAAQSLVTSLNNAGTAIATQKSQVQQQTTALISTVNNITDQIAALNGQIRASKAIGDNPNTYQDERDQLIDQLSGYMSITTSVQANGSTLVTVDGKALVNDTISYHLSAPVVGTSTAGNTLGNPEFKIGFASDPNPTNPSGINLGGGQLGGLVDLYNNKLIPYGTQLDDFANGLSSETSRLTQAGYDLTGQPGGQLFTPVINALPVSAGNIKVGITSASEVPASAATTAAGTLVTAMNASNTSIDTTVALTNNSTLFYPPGGALAGNLTIQVDGITQTYAYNTGAGGNATTVNGFINSFNSGHYGVTASFDPTSQRIVFARDPANIDLVHRAAQGANNATPDFTITDSLPTTTPPAEGTPATSLLMALGAGGISGVNQNSTNAFGATGAGGANALLTLFTASLGAPSLQTTSAVAAAVPGANTITGPAVSTFQTINVGDVLTIDAGTANQENVTVTGVNRVTGSITFTTAKPHATVGFAITTAQTQTLQQSYANFVAQLGLDTQTAITGTSTQTTLASNVDKVRQGVDGINIDEETQNLVKFQNAYAAAAQTVTIMAALLRDAVNLGGGAFA